MTLLNVGSAANDGTGDPLRTAGQKLNRLPNPSSTINADSGDYVGTTEQKITLAIAAAVATGAKYVFVPQSMLPYNASLVTFNTAVQMLREGGRADSYDLLAYGAYCDGATDDSAAFIAAIAGAGAQVSYFGSSLVACPPVVLPVKASPNGQTKSYLVTQTLALPAGLRMRGLGPMGSTIQFKPAGNSSTLFTFFGAVEAQAAQILLENIYIFQNGTASTSIGFRARNFSFIQLRQCVFSNFRVGFWGDWGQDIDCYDTQFSLCERAVQLGGNLSQSESPTPPAGVRGGPGTAWFDNGSFLFCKFSQNKVDINHLGSIQSHGNTAIINSTFFESSATPVTGKTRFIHTTSLKGLVVMDCWFEAGADGRTGIKQDQVDFDGNAGGQNLGGSIFNNHFLLTGFTGGSSGVIGVDIENGATIIGGNTFEVSPVSGSLHIKLADTTRNSTILQNSYLTYPDTLAAARYSIIGTSQIIEATGNTFGKIITGDSSVAQIEFQLNGARKAGFNVTAPDTIRVYNSAGTVVGFLGAAFVPALVSLGTGANFTPNVANGNSFTATLNGATTINAPIGMQQAGQFVTFTLIQDGSGGRSVTWNAVFKQTWSDTGNTLNKRSSISFVWDGTNWNQAAAQTTYV